MLCALPDDDLVKISDALQEVISFILTTSHIDRQASQFTFRSSVYFLQHTPFWQRHYSDGDYIVRHGVPGDALFVVNRGQVRNLHTQTIFLSHRQRRFNKTVPRPFGFGLTCLSDCPSGASVREALGQ